MKLWDKGTEVDKLVEKFTVGDDYVLDAKLLPFDCEASKAHAKMLAKIGVLKDKEAESLVNELDAIIGNGLEIKQEDEDCHTAIEKHLTEKLGDLGKKIHLGRSRNDQVLVAMRLYEKKELGEIKSLLELWKGSLNSAIKKDGNIAMPGYTHMQPAMPTTVGTWLGSFMSAADDDLALLESVLQIIDKNPLGTAAGFGVLVFDLDMAFTTKELGFSEAVDNPLYAQLGRSKYESLIMHLLSQIILSLNRFASDMMLFSMKEFGFVKLPEKLCTGSSIMPQKKNPDLLELLRAKYHVVLAEQQKVQSLTAGLISGYNRDIQLTKGPVMDSIETVKSSLTVSKLVVDGMEVDSDSCKAAMPPEIYATEEAYKLVKGGLPFRDAYRTVAKSLQK